MSRRRAHKPPEPARDKKRRRGTREWTTWLTEARMEPPYSFRHSGKRPPRAEHQ